MPRRPQNARTFLGLDHRRLERLLESALRAVAGGDRAEIRTTWGAFESGLRSHFQAEEEYILPFFAKDAPDEAAALLAEHGEFRKLMDEFGMRVDLHAASMELAQSFTEKLRAHARREAREMYAWADRDVEAAGRLLAAEGVEQAPGTGKPDTGS